MRVGIVQTVRVVIISSILISSIEAIGIKSIEEAVNIAGKQRMFTQKMLKDYGMIGIGVSFGNAKEDLKKTIDEFEDHLNSLKNFTKDTNIKDSLDKQKRVWTDIKDMLLKKPSKDNAIKLQEKLDELLKVADETTKLFADKAGEHSGKIINISGRQRMLSQRMASLYILKAWGINDSEFNKKFDEAIKLFDDSLHILMKSKLNNQEINKLLGKVSHDFDFFKIMSHSSNKFIPSLIYKKSNEILKNMDKITKLYTMQEVK